MATVLVIVAAAAAMAQCCLASPTREVGDAIAAREVLPPVPSGAPREIITFTAQALITALAVVLLLNWLRQRQVGPPAPTCRKADQSTQTPEVCIRVPYWEWSAVDLKGELRRRALVPVELKTNQIRQLLEDDLRTCRGPFLHQWLNEKVSQAADLPHPPTNYPPQGLPKVSLVADPDPNPPGLCRLAGAT